MSLQKTDRNFDDLAERFAQRIYGGLKGKIRLAIIDREIDKMLNRLSKDLGKDKQVLRVLDIGGGLGQHAVRLSQLGHSVSFNELSVQLLVQAKQQAAEVGVEHKMDWHHGAYQSIDIERNSHDMILCHAVVEWLEEPEDLFRFVSESVKPGGCVSFSFYNPAAKTYRNLIRGNFDWLKTQGEYQSDSGSLTPNTPVTAEQVKNWAEQHGFQIQRRCGIRVFSDYVVEKRGGLNSEEETLAMECEYSDKEPFIGLARYLHFSMVKK